MDGQPVLRKLFWSRFIIPLHWTLEDGWEVKGSKGKGDKGMERLEESDPKTLITH